MQLALTTRLLCAAGLAISVNAVHAIGITDPTNDFVTGYTGRMVGELDAVGAFVTYNQSTDMFTFAGILNGDIGPGDNTLYVFGVDRGAGTARFAGNGVPGVLFDSVVVLNGSGTGSVSLLTGGAGTTLDSSSVKVIGDVIIGEVKGSSLPSVGFAKTAYTWNLWPRDGKLPSGFGQISDFAPDNSNASVVVVGAPVPEPSTVGTLALGLGALVLVARRRLRS